MLHVGGGEQGGRNSSAGKLQGLTEIPFLPMLTGGNEAAGSDL